MKPKATIFAGVNGCGKTTLYYDELEKGNSFGLRINIDEIVSSFGDWRNQKDQMRAAKIALKIRDMYINTRQSFNQETTLCGNSIIKLLHALKQQDYILNLYYIGVDSPLIAQERVKIRVAKGGHNISPHLIEKRFYESLENLKVIAPLCDDILLFDNSNVFAFLAQKQTTSHKEFIKELECFITSRTKQK